MSADTLSLVSFSKYKNWWKPLIEVSFLEDDLLDSLFLFECF